ncbi:hypothetical protein MPTK2_3g08500 [Marchantia polymorpha subsp. ruderalis]
MTLISDIKLIRTDTTLDLSQKAEKGMLRMKIPFSLTKRKFLVIWIGLSVSYPKTLTFMS